MDEWGKMAEMEKDPDRINLEERGREAYQRGGIRAYALVRIDAMERRAPETARHSNDFDPAEWYAFTSQPDKALKALHQIIATHDEEAVMLAVDPMFDNLHSDPRFLAILQQVGLSLPKVPRQPALGT